MTQTTIELVPNVYQEIVDDVAGTLTKQWKVSGVWTTTAVEYGFAPNTGLEYNVGGDKVPYALGTLASDYTTTSTTNVYTGHNATLVAVDTLMELLGSITVQNSTVNDGVQLWVYRTVANGAAPSIGSAHGGSDVLVWTNTTTHAVAGQNQSVGFDFVDSGLTAGATYIYYVCMAAITGGTAKEVGAATMVNASTIELQNI
jgi:hypothetical protein